ncbi:MAG: DUF4406 domain-containing protein [Lachnospiraceae bacterium]|nr:DUF4406 domain-containing protein [Lachnospiraceae bacterium]
MKKIYIISRYRTPVPGQLEFHKRVAQHYCREIVKEGNQPIAPHLFYPQFLNDKDVDERSKGLTFGQMELLEADEFFLILVNGIISDGMAKELTLVSRTGKPGRIVSVTREEMNEILRADEWESNS